MTDQIPTSLYRLFGADDELLYVGVAGNPGRRFEQHRKDKPWWGEVITVTLEHFPTRPDALAAEVTAIEEERPRYNVVHRVDVVVEVEVDATVSFECNGCGLAIQGGAGFLAVRYEEINAHREALKRFRERTGGSFAAGDFARSVPPRAHWRAFHNDPECLPFDDEGAAAQYEIPLSRLRTINDLVARTAHLLEKKWIGDTDWHAVLNLIAHSEPPRRLRALPA